MNLYLILTGEAEYDTYDSFIVNDKNEEEATKWTPYNKKQDKVIKYPVIIHIGKSNKDLKVGVVIASFNAG